jgi:hypothetical protein
MYSCHGTKLADDSCGSVTICLSVCLSARKLLLRGAGRVGARRGAGSGCEGVWGERGAVE